jgi:FAD/FMN-containing dehydrogenase
MACYAELNQLCVEMGGKLNLVKNAFIEPAALEAMFEPSLKELVALKRRVDPSFTLNSLFLKQKFPSYFQR